MADASAHASIGFRAHAGWAAAVCLAGPAGAPTVVERARLLLTDGPLPCEPYHAANSMGIDAVQDLVRSAGEQAQTLAAVWVHGLVEQLSQSGRQLVGSGIVLGTGRPEFAMKQALRTHAAMHNAEGWLFREALMRASEACGLLVSGALESAAYDQAAAAAGLPAATVEGRVSELGRQLGPPWGRDQKLATAVAWMALAQSERSQSANIQ